MSVSVSLRPVVEADEPFLRQIFLAGRPELAALPESLIDLQRVAQRSQYDRDFPDNVDHILEAENPVGRCWTWRGPAEHRLLDLVVLNAYRGRGIGRSVLAMLADDAARQARPLRLSVWSANQTAIRLYRATGFEQYDEQNGYLLMQLSPVGIHR